MLIYLQEDHVINEVIRLQNQIDSLGKNPNDETNRGKWVNLQGTLQYQLGELNHARDLFKINFARTNKPELFLPQKSKIGLLDFETGFTKLAIHTFFEVLSFDIEPLSIEAQCCLSRIYLNQDEIYNAEKYLVKARYAAEDFGTPELDIQVHLTDALYRIKTLHHRMALQALNKAYVISRQFKLPYYEALTFVEAAEVWQSLQQYTEVVRLSDDAMTICNWFGFKFLSAKAGIYKAKGLMGLGDFEAAGLLLEKINVDCKKLGYKQLCLDALKVNLELAQKSDDKNAIARLRKAISSMEEEIGRTGAGRLKELLSTKERELKYLIQRNKAMIQQSREIEELSKVIAHDLKEPLRNIGGFTTLLQRKAESRLTEEEKGYVNTVMLATERMDVSLTKLLAFLGLTPGNNKYSLFSLQTLESSIKKILGEKVSEFETVLNINFPETEIEGDMESLQSILEELILNSIKFRTDSHTPEIEINYYYDGGIHVFEVEDNGIGIDPEYHDKIFRLFYRNDRNKEGFGMGLAYCKKMVVQQGGELLVESTAGEGAKFILKIPDFSKANDSEG